MKRVIIFISIFFFITGCVNKSLTPGPEISEEADLDSFPAQCPYFTKDQRGNTVISWVRMKPDSTTAFCYSVNRIENGKAFGSIIEIPNTGNIQPHGENLPKIIFKPSGEIIALYGVANPNSVNKYSGLVFYTQSFDDGKTWTVPRGLVSDSSGFDQRYYDVALLKNGDAAICWLDNRKSNKKDGSALYFAISKDESGFTNEKKISESCCQCCRTDLFVDKQGTIHTLYRAIFNDSIRDIVHIESPDNGLTFSTPKKISDDNWVINGCPHTGPSMSENEHGLHYAWFTGGKNPGSFYSNNGMHKTNAANDRISLTGSHPQMIARKNGNIVVAWDEMFMTGNTPTKRIGLQLRESTGKTLWKDFITEDSGIASYPVVAEDGNNLVFIAYVKKVNEQPFIAYRTVK